MSLNKLGGVLNSNIGSELNHSPPIWNLGPFYAQNIANQMTRPSLPNGISNFTVLIISFSGNTYIQNVYHLTFSGHTHI